MFKWYFYLGFPEFFGFYHQENEIWYNNSITPGSSYVEYDADESKKRSDGVIDLSVEDHLKYFNIDVSGYGYSSCK